MALFMPEQETNVFLISFVGLLQLNFWFRIWEIFSLFTIAKIPKKSEF